MSVVLDTSAVLAFYLDEPGATMVSEAIDTGGGVISTVNLAALRAKLDDLRNLFSGPVRELPFSSLLDEVDEPQAATVGPGELAVEEFTRSDAETSGGMRSTTKEFGLSLGDRACLDLAKRLGLPVLTADRSWAEVAEVIGVTVRLIR